MLLTAPTPPQPDNTFTFFIISLFSTIFGTAIGIVVSLLIARKQRNRKLLAYEIVSDAPIANINEEVKDRVAINFDGKPVQDMNVAVLRVLNVGNRAVTVADYGKPFKFEFEGREAIDGNVLDTSTKEVLDLIDMKEFLSFEQGNITLKPILLNPGEVITIKALIVGLKGEIKGSARIAEGKVVEYEHLDEGLVRPRKIFQFASIFTLVLVLPLMFGSIYSMIDLIDFMTINKQIVLKQTDVVISVTFLSLVAATCTLIIAIMSVLSISFLRAFARKRK